MRATVGRGRLPGALTGNGPWTPAIVFGLALAAWLGILAWAASPYARYLDHEYQPAGATDLAASLMLFVTGWTLMVVAMMLPTASRLFERFDRLVRRRPDRTSLLVMLTAGFVLTWLIVGYLFRAGDAGLHTAVAAVGWLEERPELISGAVLVGAGLYQFTALKSRCLTACRSPQSFIYRHWQGGRPGSDAFRIGLAYGVSCVGCCWTLMLVLFALGTASVIWMFGLATVMAVEKMAPFGPRLARPVGAVLVALGVGILGAG